MQKYLLPLVGLLAAGCAQQSDSSAALDEIAQDYLLLQLTIGEKEAGYIDAYYGPEDVQQRAVAEAQEQTLTDLSRRSEELSQRAQEFVDDGSGGDSDNEHRARFLVAQLTAAQTRLRMMQGEEIPFVEEAKGLFGVNVELIDLETLDPVIAEIDALVPGEGPLWRRLDNFDSQFNIPSERLGSVMDAAIAECKRRTIAHIGLPDDESFSLEFVTDKPWGGWPNRPTYR